MGLGFPVTLTTAVLSLIARRRWRFAAMSLGVGLERRRAGASGVTQQKLVASKQQLGFLRHDTQITVHLFEEFT